MLTISSIRVPFDKLVGQINSFGTGLKTTSRSFLISEDACVAESECTLTLNGELVMVPDALGHLAPRPSEEAWDSDREFLLHVDGKGVKTYRM